jgi:hypothetical protein
VLLIPSLTQSHSILLPDAPFYELFYDSYATYLHNPTVEKASPDICLQRNEPTANLSKDQQLNNHIHETIYKLNLIVSTSLAHSHNLTIMNQHNTFSHTPVHSPPHTCIGKRTTSTRFRTVHHRKRGSVIAAPNHCDDIHFDVAFLNPKSSSNISTSYRVDSFRFLRADYDFPLTEGASFRFKTSRSNDTTRGGTRRGMMSYASARKGEKRESLAHVPREKS